MTTPPDSTPRRSFQQRLLLTVGSVLAVTFVVLGVLAWFAASAWLNRYHRDLLLREAREIASHILTPEDSLDVSRYAWYEPHHRFADARIDPFFVQIFSPDGTLRYATANLDDFENAIYPEDLLPLPPRETPSFASLHRLTLGPHRLYFEVVPLRDSRGRLRAYLQMGRYDPGLDDLLRDLALGLTLGLGALWLVLALLVRASARRVLRPLAAITAATADLSAADLSRRIPVPEDADRETARLAQTLNVLLDRLEAAFAEMRRFTAHAAHELQTPLAILQGNIDVALRRERSPEAYRQTLITLRHELTHLTALVRNLLTMARLDREHQVLPRQPVDLGALAARVAATFEPVLNAKGIALELTLDNAVTVYGQPDLLERVVHNLMDNAAKYTEAGQVSVSVRRQGDRALLCVADTGPGIPETALPDVMRPFFRAAPPDTPGSGLGLTLAERVVRLHGGCLTLAPRPGGGTRACVTLPCHTARPAPAGNTGVPSTSA
ncbi:MAG: two-component sensor histidine kinase [Rhodothermaceae bacterium]|nr:MAG: two-component sensor histidine kinase [Rhodothermaceae bacterium]